MTFAAGMASGTISMIQATLANIVVIPRQQVNASTFGQVWLLNNGIFTSQELTEAKDAAYLPVMVAVRAPAIEMVLLPQRLQFNSVPADGGFSADFLQRFERFIRASGLAISNIGFNFVFQVSLDLSSEAARSKLAALVTNVENPLVGSDRGESLVGLYWSEAVDGGRWQVDAKQLKSQPLMNCAFNFDFGVNDSADALVRVGQSIKYRELALSKVQGLEKVLSSGGQR